MSATVGPQGEVLSVCHCKIMKKIMKNYSWPPEIIHPVLPVQNRQVIKSVRKAIAALWLTGIGILMSLSVMQCSDLFRYGSLAEPLPGYFGFMFVGLACDFLGLLFGILSRKTTAGKFGLILSFLALVSIPVLVLAYHAHNGNWPWLTDDCGCL